MYDAAAEKVGSIEDLLIKILLGLPLTSLRLCISVCKNWFSLLTNPTFTHLRKRKDLNVDHPCVLFLQLKTASNEFAFVPLDASRSPVKRSITTYKFPFEVNALGAQYDEVMHSCNGLLLCYAWPDKLYVYNPTVSSVYKKLPLPHVWKRNRFLSRMALAFDPMVSPHYKVFYPREANFRTPGIPVHIEIYSSETANWSVCSQTYSILSFVSLADCRFIYWHDAFHWIDDSGEVYHFSLQDTDNPHFIQEVEPLKNSQAFFTEKLFVSSDCLLLVHPLSPLVEQMNVYQMKNDYSGWLIKYHLNLSDIITTGGPPNFNVLSIVLGEKEEYDPFIVLEQPGIDNKLLQFNIISNMFNELCDLTTVRPRDTKCCSFLFNPSLAAVDGV